MTDKAAAWIRFLRQYGPIAINDNMYDEHIRASAKRAGFEPLRFTHPMEQDLLALFRPDATEPMSVVLTGTAGDGKSHLCGKVWKMLGGGDKDWSSDDVYYRLDVTVAGRPVTVHIVRDLTALPAKDDAGRYESKTELMGRFCTSLFDPERRDVFLIAANDGQLMESWQRLDREIPAVVQTHDLLESLLVEDRRTTDGVPLHLFNLSHVASVTLFDLAITAFLEHDGWQACISEARAEEELFGARCPIRHNYQLLRDSLVKKRLRALFELCDHNDVHISVRRILLLLANAVLGHPDARDALMRAQDIKGIIGGGTIAKASVFNNIFGGNLTETRRESLEVFDALNRFRIGHETSNIIDSLLIFGGSDETLRPHFDKLLGTDPEFYGADKSYGDAQRAYVEGADEGDDAAKGLLELMVSQRRRLFFIIPPEDGEKFGLWDLTVFQYGGEYLENVIGALSSGRKVERAILARLVRGLNRVFVGMLVTTERDLLLATSLSSSNGRVSQVLEDRIPVGRRNQESVEIQKAPNGRPAITVQLSAGLSCSLELNLRRFEFLCRVATGALPGSFSRECYEDILAFKSRLLTGLSQRRQAQGSDDSGVFSCTLLSLDPQGNPTDEVVEFAHV
ncbi:MAG: hypothetical protein U0441_23360 [Polyangiaceae bacterium]